MPQVPYQPLPTVSPNQPLEPQRVQASPQAFGSQVSAATQDLGGNISNLGENLSNISREMFAAQLRLQSREDAIERARDYGTFDEEANKKLISLSTEGDLSRQETVNGYRQFIDEAKNRIVSEHRGSPESKMQLMEKLEQSRARMIGTAAGLSVKAQQDMMQKNIGNNLNVLTGRAYESPGSMLELFQQLDDQLMDIAPGLSPGEEANYRDGGRAKIAGTAIESFIGRGDFESAERVLQMPGVSDVIGVEAQNKMRGTILESKMAMRKASMKGITEGVQEREKLRALLRREPTDAEVAIAAGVTAKEGQGSFGTGITGRSLDILTQGAPLYAQNMLSDDQERTFEAALTQYRQPVTMVNPDTGMIETRRPELPPFVAEALRRRGINIPQSTPSNFDAGLPAPEPIGTSAGGEPIFEAPDEATAQRMMQDAESRGVKMTVRVKPSGEGQQKIWDMASKVAGPIAAGANFLASTPGIGDVISFPSFTQAKNYVPVLINDLVKVLQNNPRFSEGERSQIRKELELDPKAFDTPQAFRNRMIGVDNALAVREKNAYETARSPNVSLEERKHAMNVFNGIVRFREAMGVPPTVKSPEEAKKLGSGAQFLDPKGNIRRVP